jgi:hypothetical protein
VRGILWYGCIVWAGQRQILCVRVVCEVCLSVVKDLVLYMSNFYSQYKSIKPCLQKKGARCGFSAFTCILGVSPCGKGPCGAVLLLGPDAVG